MEDIKLEVQIVGDGLVKTNAEQVLEVIEYGLKSYRYVVNESNYEQAKKDRAALNKLIKNVSDERKRVEEKLFGAWKKDKANIMAIEKKIKVYSDELGNGINLVDQRDRDVKKAQIAEFWDSLHSGYPYDKVHDEKYLNKSTSTKSIEDDLKAKLENIRNMEEIMETFLPEDAIDRNRVINVFRETLDVTRAKAEADAIARNRAEVEARQKAMEEAKAQREMEAAQQVEEEPIHQEEPKPYQPQPQLLMRWMKIEGTVEQLTLLQKYMKEIGIHLLDVKKPQ